MRLALVLASAAAILAPLGLAQLAAADEGMWTFDNFPSAKVKQLYGFAPDAKWLNRVRAASVRLDGGCSGSVVSKDGLVLTNHHCVAGCATELSSAGNDYAQEGFLAAQRKDERTCPGAEASILQSSTDVTARVKAATANVALSDAAGARAAVIATIEKEACGEDRKKRCEVVNLYRGGQYQLYVYDRYDDLRLAFVPEFQAGFFGGDPDNFNFPRYAFDMALVRLYRDGKPVAFADPLQLDPAGAKEGDLTFVSGHPGTTERLFTISQLQFQRDQFLPWRIEYMTQLRGELINEATKGDEEARQVNEALQLVENSVKVFKGQRGALVEPSFFAAKQAEEKKLRDALAADPKLRAAYGDPFADIAAVMPAQKANYLPYQMLEARFGAGSVLLGDARMLVRAAAERAKPEEVRLAEFSASRLPSTEKGLLADAPILPFIEQLEIAFWLDKTREYLGPDHPAVKALFGSQTSNEIAAQIVSGSQLGDGAMRRKLWEHPELVDKSTDPAIALVRRIDAFSRAARQTWESAVSSPVSVASEKVAALRFAVMGKNVYPDATFTLRLSYGTVKGWIDPVHGQVQPFTYVSGLWERATGAFPFNLAKRWQSGRDKIAGTTQMDFVTTNDITGGNSGSPLVNKEGRIVGLAFDGNIHSTAGDFGFDPALNRCVAVSSQLILEGLRKIYGADALADELMRK
ncbi:MAG TPA: S46 family peptidase [Hyphomonadaceae bacterium]|nr:S46 family peptidase [Hyphomonadaceae bacterium]